ncbi:hypothetical protein [Paraburkholderia sp. HD33-4]|uniref:hypothetical protein n=1 Tax=Paraburkholderia sp. HD33-4 TaxID=2883242 RepID=UPI001F490E3D|nr:hypothetical protein [Paraburkholderia sp. HD33-4]
MNWKGRSAARTTDDATAVSDEPDRSSADAASILETGHATDRKPGAFVYVEGDTMTRGQVVGLLCSALLAGCLSAGVEVRPEEMSHFKPGVTTLQQVIAALGPASVESALDDGSTLLVYTYVTSRPHPESFLPFIGSLIGGGDTHTSAAVFLFNPRGVLKSANTTTSNIGTGLSSGLGAGQHSASTPAAQPRVEVRSVPPEAVQSVEPLPEQEVQPATQNDVEPPPAQEGESDPIQ